MAWDGNLEPLRPEDSISCVGEEGFKSRRRDSPLFDSRYGRNRVKARPPTPLKVIDSWVKPSSTHQRTAAALPRSKPKTTTTTTTTYTVQHHESPRYIDHGIKTTLPLRPPHSRKHSSSKHPQVVDREPSFVSSSSKSILRAPPPRSNDRFYEHRRVEPVESRGRTVAVGVGVGVGGSSDAGRRTIYTSPRAYSQDRGNGSGTGVYSAFGSLRGTSRERGRGGGNEQSGSRDRIRGDSRRLSNVGSSYVETKGGYCGYGHLRR